MVIVLSVQYNGGFLSGIILLALCDYFGDHFQYHAELLSLQPGPMFTIRFGAFLLVSPW